MLWNAITLPKHSHNKTKPKLKNQIAKSQNRKLHELNEQVPSVSGVNQVSSLFSLGTYGAAKQRAFSADSPLDRESFLCFCFCPDSLSWQMFVCFLLFVMLLSGACLGNWSCVSRENAHTGWFFCASPWWLGCGNQVNRVISSQEQNRSDLPRQARDKSTKKKPTRRFIFVFLKPGRG